MIVPRVDHHANAHRGKFNVSQSAQEIPILLNQILLNQAGLEPPFKQGAAASVGEIEISNVEPSCAN